MDNGFQIRLAVMEDVPVIIRQRRAMFEQIGDYDPVKLDAMSANYIRWVKELLVRGDYVGWFIINESQEIVAGAGMWIQQLMPNPYEASGYRGHIVNVYTEQDYRHQGLARQLMITLLDWAKAHGITSLTLNASVYGRSLYESLGFKQDNHMFKSLLDD